MVRKIGRFEKSRLRKIGIPLYFTRWHLLTQSSSEYPPGVRLFELKGPSSLVHVFVGVAVFQKGSALVTLTNVSTTSYLGGILEDIHIKILLQIVSIGQK